MSTAVQEAAAASRLAAHCQRRVVFPLRRVSEGRYRLAGHRRFTGAPARIRLYRRETTMRMLRESWLWLTCGNAERQSTHLIWR